MSTLSRPTSLLRIDWKRFAADLGRERIQRGVSVRQLQSITGVLYTSISRVERGDGKCDAEAFLSLVWWLRKDPLSYANKVAVPFEQWINQAD